MEPPEPDGFSREGLVEIVLLIIEFVLMIVIG